jgi:hypothetical protein
MSAGLLLYQQSTERNAHSTVLGYGMREATNVAHACLVRWFSEEGVILKGGGASKRRSLEEMAILGRRHFPWRAAKERHCWEIRQTGRVCALSPPPHMSCHAGVGARLVRRNVTGIGICETDPYMTSAKPNVKRERHGGEGAAFTSHRAYNP